MKPSDLAGDPAQTGVEQQVPLGTALLSAAFYSPNVDYVEGRDAIVFVRLESTLSGGRGFAVGKVTSGGVVRKVGAASVYRSHLNWIPPDNVEVAHGSFSMGVPAGATFRVEHVQAVGVDVEIHVFYL